MKDFKRRFISGALALAIFVTSALGLVSIGAQSAGASGVTISGTGSSYAAIAINAWVSQIYTSVGTSVNYQSSSSVLGLENFAQSLVDFGASEIGYSSGQTASTPPSDYQYMPDIAGAMCVMYNVLGKTGQQVRQLLLNPETIAGIFTGTIRYWDDPAVATLNPSAMLPHNPLTVTFRNDPSGDNYIFSDYIHVTSPSVWSGFTGAMGYPDAATAIWPTPQSGGNVAGQYNESSWVSQSGSDNASNYVASSLNTMTYVETGYALQHNMPCAYVKNNFSGGGAPQYVQPSEIADSLALTKDGINLTTGEQDLASVFLGDVDGGYPISAYSYLVTRSSGLSADQGKALSQFVLFLSCQGQQSAARLGYAPLPPNLVAADWDAISKMNGHVPLPATLDASTCPNPYLTGDLQSVGSPPVLNQPSGGKYSAQVGTGGEGAASTGTSKNSGVLSSSGPGKTSGGSVTASGGAAGVDLVAASNQMLGLPGPTGLILLWTLGFALVFGVPLGFMGLSRRRRAEVLNGKNEGKIDD